MDVATGTILVDGVCQLAPVESSGWLWRQGTVMVNGVCQLDRLIGNFNPTTLYRRWSSRNRRCNYWNCLCCKEGIKWNINDQNLPRQDLDDYESQVPSGDKVKDLPAKPAETRPTSSSCNSCGKPD